MDELGLSQSEYLTCLNNAAGGRLLAMKKYTIQMDFEGMQHELQPYDGLITRSRQRRRSRKNSVKKNKRRWRAAVAILWNIR